MNEVPCVRKQGDCLQATSWGQVSGSPRDTLLTWAWGECQGQQPPKREDSDTSREAPRSQSAPLGGTKVNCRPSYYCSVPSLFGESARARVPWAPGSWEIKKPNNATPSAPGSSKTALLHVWCQESASILGFTQPPGWAAEASLTSALQSLLREAPFPGCASCQAGH